MARTALLFAIALAAAYCGKHGGIDLGTIPVSIGFGDQTIPGYADQSAQSLCTVNLAGNTAISPDSLQAISFNIKASEELDGRGELRFTHVEVDKITLNIISPSQSGQTWDFLDSIRLFARKVGDTDATLVAVLDPVPRGQTTIVANGTNANISDIASADRFEIFGQVSGRPPCADVHFDGDVDFDVSLF
jgi:hypothetical protein